MPAALTLLDLGPRPEAVIAAIDMVLEVGPRRAAELVEHLPAPLARGPLAEVLSEELERLGAVVDWREPPAAPPVSPATASIRLLAPGDDRVQVAKLIRLATGVTFAEARRLVAAAPTDVAVAPARAAALRRDLEAAGARLG